MSATFETGQRVKFIKEWKYGQRGELVCEIGTIGKIYESASSIKYGKNRTEAVKREDTNEVVRGIPVAYIEHA